MSIKLPEVEVVNIDQTFQLFKPSRTILRYSDTKPLPIIESVIVIRSNVIPDFPLSIKAFPVVEPKPIVESFLLNKTRQPYQITEADYDAAAREERIKRIYEKTWQAAVNDSRRLDERAPSGWVDRLAYPYYLSIYSDYPHKGDEDFYAQFFKEKFKGFNIENPRFSCFVDSCRLEIVYGQNTIIGSRSLTGDGLDFDNFLPPGVSQMVALSFFPIDEMIASAAGSGFRYPMISNIKREITGLKGKLFIPGEPFDPTERPMEPSLQEVPKTTWQSIF